MAHLLANGLHENKQTMHLGFRQTNSISPTTLDKQITNFKPIVASLGE